MGPVEGTPSRGPWGGSVDVWGMWTVSWEPRSGPGGRKYLIQSQTMG